MTQVADLVRREQALVFGLYFLRYNARSRAYTVAKTERLALAEFGETLPRQAR